MNTKPHKWKYFLKNRLVQCNLYEDSVTTTEYPHVQTLGIRANAQHRKLAWISIWANFSRLNIHMGKVFTLEYPYGQTFHA